MIIVLISTHPAASVTVSVYEPTDNPDKLGKESGKLLQVYVNGKDTPEATTLIDPSEPPLQETFTELILSIVGPVRLLILAIELAEHPLKSVTVTV